MKKIIALILCLASSFAFANPITIPSVEKIFEERFIGISEPFYGCIYSIDTYEEEDLYSTKILIESVIVGNVNQQIEIKEISQFKDLDSSEANFPKIGDCFAYKPRGSINIDSRSNAKYSGYADLYQSEFTIDNNITKAILKDKLTIDEYCHDNISYGNQWVELTGKVKNTEINRYGNFQTLLVSSNDDEVYGVMKEQDWKGNEIVKEQLRSFILGETVTVFGYFGFEKPCSSGRYSMFNILEIIDSKNSGTKNEDLTEVVKEVDYYNNGQKKSEKSYKNGQENGKTLYWTEDGKLLQEENWKNGKLDGKLLTWYPNGNLMGEGNYKDGKEHGKWTGWFQDGKLLYEKYYKDGIEIE